MTDIIFDLETLGLPPDGVIVAGAFLVFDMKEKYTFKQLVDKALYVKFNIKEQKKSGRVVNSDTIAWWKKQSKEAQKELLPSNKDLSMIDAINKIKQYFNDNGIHNSKKVFGFCRGQSFDFPLIVDLFEKNNLPHYWLVDFWRQRDVRTFIGATLGDHQIDKITLPEEILDIDNFVAHNCTHDIARDVLMMQHALKIAYGEEE